MLSRNVIHFRIGSHGQNKKRQWLPMDGPKDRHSDKDFGRLAPSDEFSVGQGGFAPQAIDYKSDEKQIPIML